MNYINAILLFVLLVAFFGGMTYFILYIERDGAVVPPKHIAVSEMERHSAQEVYDWVVYATRILGIDYLEQLRWERAMKHDFLLSDLKTVLHARSHDDMLERLKEIGHSFRLDTAIVDEIF